MARKPGSKQLIIEFFLRNVGKVLESKDIQKASGGAVEWARRVRELRNEDGYQILSHKDRVYLKPNQYLLETIERIPHLLAVSLAFWRDRNRYEEERDRISRCYRRAAGGRFFAPCSVVC